MFSQSMSGEGSPDESFQSSIHLPAILGSTSAVGHALKCWITGEGRIVTNHFTPLGDDSISALPRAVRGI